MFQPPGANTGALRGLIRTTRYLPAKRSFAADDPELKILTVQHPSDELFRVATRWGQQ
jgi:hypothetical protein